MVEETHGTAANANNQGNKYKLRKASLPIAKNEDVEFSCAQADEDDLEAVERAHAADQRQETTL